MWVLVSFFFLSLKDVFMYRTNAAILSFWVQFPLWNQNNLQITLLGYCCVTFWLLLNSAGFDFRWVDLYFSSHSFEKFIFKLEKI